MPRAAVVGRSDPRDLRPGRRQSLARLADMRPPRHRRSAMRPEPGHLARSRSGAGRAWRSIARRPYLASLRDVGAAEVGRVRTATVAVAADPYSLADIRPPAHLKVLLRQASVRHDEADNPARWRPCGRLRIAGLPSRNAAPCRSGPAPAECRGQCQTATLSPPGAVARQGEGEGRGEPS